MVVCETFPSLYSQTQKYTAQGHSEMRTKGEKFYISCCHKITWKVTFSLLLVWKFYLLVTQAQSP